MNNLPVSSLDYKRIFTYLFIILLVFGAVYYISNRVISQLQPSKDSTNSEVKSGPQEYKGRVKYLTDRSRESEGVSYYLADESGKELYLLKSLDDKLAIVENHFVTVQGSLSKTDDNLKDVVIVDKVVLTGEKDVTN